MRRRMGRGIASWARKIFLVFVASCVDLNEISMHKPVEVNGSKDAKDSVSTGAPVIEYGKRRSMTPGGVEAVK